MKIEVQKFGTTWIYHFFGYLNEDAKIPSVDDPSVTELQLNLEKLTMVNSVGIRTWFKFTKSIGPNVSVQLIHLPKVFVSQANMVSGFLPKNSQIQSFELPYYCEHCDLAESKYCTPQQALEQLQTPLCRKCKGTMELDAVADSYFKFLK